MNSRRKTILAVTVLAGALVCATALVAGTRLSGSAGSAPLSPEQKANSLIDKLATGSMTVDPASSNPFDYAANNASMDALVALGTPALVVTNKQLAAATEDGLTEYLMAIAAERIAKVNLSAEFPSNPLETGKAWMSAWHAHLKAIPANVAAIAQSDASQDEKTARLVALGIPAIPFILDQVAARDRTLAPAATQLAQGTVEVQGIDMPSVVTEAWARDEVARFSELRHLVMAQQ